MATFSTLQYLLPLLLSLLLSPSLAFDPYKPESIILSIYKDTKSLQYFSGIEMGTPPVPMQLVVDIRERFLWFECGDDYNSSTYRPVQCGTRACKMARGSGCVDCTDHPLKAGCTNHTCAVEPFNPFAEFFVSGDVGDDTLSSLYSEDGGIEQGKIRVPRFISSCVYPNKFGVQGFLKGLAKGMKGVLGLGRTQISLPMQIASKYKLDKKFALCLPSQTKGPGGDLFIGGGPYYMPSLNASNLLVYTPLVLNRRSTGPIFDNRPSSEYFIGVKSIKVDGKFVSFKTSLLSIDKHGNGGSKLSTVIPYTKLHTSIYKQLVSDFVKKSEVRKMKRVAAVAPFGACFDSRSVGKGCAGPDVPVIDLVLKGGVEWRIHGANSMVEANENVLCLGFVDGGLEGGSPIATSIIVGGHQLEDNLLEFDLVSSRLGFTSSLLLNNSSCSQERM